MLRCISHMTICHLSLHSSVAMAPCVNTLLLSPIISDTLHQATLLISAHGRSSIQADNTVSVVVETKLDVPPVVLSCQGKAWGRGGRRLIILSCAVIILSCVGIINFLCMSLSKLHNHIPSDCGCACV